MTRDSPDTIISKEERSQPHYHANHMLWGLKLCARYTNRHSMGPNNPTLWPMS